MTCILWWYTVWMRQNSSSIYYFSHFKKYISMFFSTVARSCHHYHCPFQNIFITPSRNPEPICSRSTPSPLQFTCRCHPPIHCCKDYILFMWPQFASCVSTIRDLGLVSLWAIFFMYSSQSRMTESRKGLISILITGYFSVFESLSYGPGLGEFFYSPEEQRRRS